MAFSVWAKVDDKVLHELLYEDHQITNNEWNNGSNIFVSEYICPFKHIFQFHREVRKSWPNKAKIYATRIKVTKNAKGKIVPYKRIMRLVNNLY